MRSPLILVAAMAMAAIACHTDRTSANQPNQPEGSGADPARATRSADGTVVLAPDSPQLKRIRIAVVQDASVPRNELVVPGKVEWNPARVSRLAMPVAGRVREVLVNLGDSVRQGQTVLAVDSPDVGAALGSEFLPQLDEGVMWIRANLPPGISLIESSQIAGDIRRIVAGHSEVRMISSQTGRNDSGTDPFGPNRNEFLIALTPYNTWPPGRTKAALVDELRQELSRQIPGVMLNFTQPIIDTVTESVTGSSADLAVIISGPDLARLRALARRSLAVIREVPGSTDSAIEQEADQPGLRIQIDRAKIARYGLNVEDLAALIESAVGGRAVSTLFEGERQFDITTRYEATSRSDIAGLNNILVHTGEGARVPLGQLAAIQVADAASIIARRENQRQISVRTNIRHRDQGSFVKEAQRRFAREIQLPAGYQVTWGGQFENLERARRRMNVVLPITIAIIFSLLFFTFGSTVSALLVLLNVPFSIIGGLVALYLRGINLSVSAVVGFISLFGVAVMSGVLYISEIERRRREENFTLELAVLMGARSQLRPVLVLMIVALLGMMPAATARGIGSDVQRPLATVVVGGLLSTLLLTLLTLPILYYVVERWRGRRHHDGGSAEDADGLH